jgi:hypothetical protein
MSDLGDAILAVTRSVTKEWTKQRKAEERGSRRPREYVYSDRVDFTEVAHEILPGGYAHASGGGRYTVDKRQFYYAVRDDFLKATGREITGQYFSQNILVKYMNQHPAETAAWKITASPRGTIMIPNAGYDLRIPCGTVAVEEFLSNARVPVEPFDGLDELFQVQWPSLAEGQRYQGVLYIEKEGFDPQLREARIAERFDIVLASCKGQSVTAARMFVDQVCRVLGGVPLFTATDFDKSGPEIGLRLTTVSDAMREKDLVKYEFRNEVDVRYLGLRLADAERYGLKSERFRFKGRFAPDTILTAREQEFLRSNRRIELNAFTAPQFIDWVETSLRKAGLKERLIPDDDVLAAAYRRALALAAINRAIDEVREEAVEEARAATVPASLRRQLKKGMKDSPDAWDKVLYELVTRSACPDGG